MASVSHSASLAGNYRVISGAIKQEGVLETDAFFEMMDMARVLEKGFGKRENSFRADEAA